MKKYIIIISLLFVLVAASGCIGQGATGSGKVVNESRTVSGFNQVSVGGSGTLIIIQGAQESLQIEAEDNVVSSIKTNVNNNNLNITIDRTNIVPTRPIVYYLTVKDINSLTYSGSGKIQSDNLNLNSLTININGASEGNLTNFNAQTLEIVISGAGKITISGNVNDQNISINGAGEYNANNLASKTATISINGASRATVRVSDVLNALINGGGQINYIGNPQLNQQINGAGEIKQIQG